MRLKIERSEASRRDLIEIWQFVADRHRAGADGLLRRILEVLELLAENPEMGRERPELAPALRSFPVDNYSIFYSRSESSLQLVRVIRFSREITPEMFEN